MSRLASPLLVRAGRTMRRLMLRIVRLSVLAALVGAAGVVLDMLFLGDKHRDGE